MKNFKKNLCINPAIWLLLVCLLACNRADKKSSLEKDSVAGDMAVTNRIGGSETYETKLDEAAADHLTHITQLLLMEYHLLAPHKDKSRAETSPALQQLLKINRISFKRIEAYAAVKRVILPSVLLDEQQISLDSLKSLSTANSLKRRLNLLKINGTTLLKRLQSAEDNREQGFRTLMNEEFTDQQEKNLMINSL